MELLYVGNARLKMTIQLFSNDLNTGTLHVMNTLDIKEPYEYIVAIDKFGRQWKLTPNINENIKFPFITIKAINDKS
jgi:hypothetical protein